MIAFSHARTDDHKLVIRQPRHGEIPSNAAAHTDQGRQTGASDSFGHVIGKNCIQPVSGLRASHAVFGKIRDIDNPGILTQHPTFTPHRFKPVLTGKTIGVFRPRCISKPLHMLPAIIQAEYPAQRLLYGMNRTRAHRTSGFTFFIGKVNGKAFGILIAHTCFGECLICPIAKARHVPSKHIVLAFAVYHPLCRHEAHAS